MKIINLYQYLISFGVQISYIDIYEYYIPGFYCNLVSYIFFKPKLFEVYKLEHLSYDNLNYLDDVSRTKRINDSKGPK